MICSTESFEHRKEHRHLPGGEGFDHPWNRGSVFLAVLKRFGAANHGMLSFPTTGWTLAVDIPAGVDGVARILDEMDERVVDEGGRIYLAKDSRMNPRHLASMYPRLNEFRSVRDEIDPSSRFKSNLSQRLGL